MLEKVLRDKPLRLYLHYLSQLNPRDIPSNEIQLTNEIIRFLLCSRRIHNALSPTSQRIKACDGEFCISLEVTDWDLIEYYHQNPIVLATLSLLHHEKKDRCFRMILNVDGGNQLDRIMLKFMFWAKRNSSNFFLDAQLRSKLLSQVMDDLGYRYENFGNFNDVIYYHYVQDLHKVLSKSTRNRNAVLIYGADFSHTHEEEDGWRRQPCRNVYLHGLLGHPKLTELILENCNGFTLCDYLPKYFEKYLARS
ncbi:unnamed protein product [Bursaphelenchus xylophilus]|uniref:(pine wood nematode) hypothetical protein n=1 Tax=Bursaphelenchus xylophilus TaxID=6326 RepID=A0A7I8WYD3_BURXY|nr:unnamed protein product [Bursaphelenchus xylophilus]CAG9101412.1 unnamed protein product [Bursaphelenchus xylophilus]